jgi:mono/diheme cytochrome c family protein
LAGCGGERTVTPTPETVEGTVPQQGPEVDLASGNADRGKTIFTETAQPTCGSCHTYEAAGTNAQVGPDLDDALADKDAEFVLESIVDPSAEVAPGFQDIMPKDYEDKLDPKQLADLVAFLKPES